MKLEEAIPFLRDGIKIYRNEEQGFLGNPPETGSCYLTTWDILADDWKIWSEDDAE